MTAHWSAQKRSPSRKPIRGGLSNHLKVRFSRQTRHAAEVVVHYGAMMDRATGLAGLGVLLLAIYPLSAKGLEPILPSRVCQALVDQKPISECFAAIKQVPVDPLAAGACLRLKVNYPVSMCMRTIAGKRYSPAEISECDDLEDVWETIGCFYQSGQRVAPRNYSGTYADQICPKLQSSRLIRLCVAAFQESYIQPSAALACDRIKGAKQTLDCLTAIMNQRYSEAEVAACDGLATSPETIACFSREVASPDEAVPPPVYSQSDAPPMYPRPQRSAEPGGCNSYGCYGPGGGCNSYGCFGFGGGCNSYGCWKNGGGCNSYGCWHSRYGSCNSYGCTAYGICNSYGCPKAR